MVFLDTNTVSYYFRGDPQVVPKLQALRARDVGIPAIVALELRFGLVAMPGAQGKPRLKALEDFLRPLRIVAFDDACATQAARLRASLEDKGTPIGPYDLLIAATALAHQATLITRNEREFSRVEGLNWINWHR